MNKQYLNTARFEHLFWLQILGDHSRFIYYSLSVNEKTLIQQAETFISTFDSLLEYAKHSYQATEINELTNAAIDQANNIRNFKLYIIQKQLTKDIKISLTPTFLNHMVNEVEEYIRILSYLKKKEFPPTVHPLHHHLIWLLDARGHASAINSSLAQIEHQLTEKSRNFTKTFEKFYLKSVEMAGFLRANIDHFPALTRFNSQVKLEMTIFQKFLEELEEMEMDEEVLSTFSPLMADHMFREECYYLTKLAESADQSLPDCDPTKPRNTKD